MDLEEEATDGAADDGGILAMALRESGLLGPTGDEPEESTAGDEPGTDQEPAAEDTPPAEADTPPVEEAAVEEAAVEEAAVEEAAVEEAAVEEAVAEEAVAEEAVAEETPTDDTPAEGSDEEVAPPPKPQNPYELPGDWYVIHSYSGYENKVKVNLQTRISTMHMDSAIFDVVIPMEDVVEIKGGKKVTVPKKVLPGYLLVRMYMDDDAWFTVRNTPGVTGFVGSGTKPSPLTRREVERFLGTPEEAGEETKAAPRFKPAWDVGESVRVVEGPFADFNGVIEDINLDQSKVRVLVNIFDRETPVELTFEQIVKI